MVARRPAAGCCATGTGRPGISSLELARRLGIGIGQTAAWTIKHKLQQVMRERDADKLLGGRIELDDAYLGGATTGGKCGRGAAGKTPFLAAVETTPEGRPVRLKLRRVGAFSGHAVARFARRSLDPACVVVSDGLACFRQVAEAGCAHQPMITGGGIKAVRNPTFRWVNTALGNIKAAITGTYRAISQKHVPRYLADFECRFNPRYDLAAVIPRLATAALQTPPMPYRLLKPMAARPMTDSATPASPCTGYCTLDPQRQHCLGCHRSLAEIAAWPSASAAARQAILAAVACRQQGGSAVEQPAASSETRPCHQTART